MRPQGYVANQHSDPVIWILTRIRDMIWMIPKVNHVCSSLYIRNISALKAARGISLSLSLSPPPPPTTTTTTTQIEWTAYRLCHRICVVIKYATHEVFDASGFDVFLIRYWQESVYSLSESVEVLLQRASVDFLTWK